MPELKRILTALFVISILSINVYAPESTAQMATWSVPMNISSASSDMSPQIVFFQGKLYSFWEDVSGHLTIASSSDGGASWSEPQVLSGYNGDLYVVDALSSDSGILFMWVDRGVGFSIIYTAFSENGIDWDVSQVGSGNAEYRISSACDGNDVWLIGSDGNGGSHVYMSSDGGRSWKHIADVSGLPSYNSDLITEGNVLHLIASSDTGIMDYRSEDMGKTWDENTIYSGKTYGSLWAGSHGGELYAIWSGEDSSRYQLMISMSNDSGATWSAAEDITVTSGSAYNPDAAFDSAGNIHLLWKDNRFGEWDIFYMEMDSQGNRLVGDTQINEKSSGTAPSICSCGNFISALWAGNSAVMFSRFPDMTPSFTGVHIANSGIYTGIDVYADIVDDDPISFAGITYRDVHGVSHDILMDYTGTGRDGYPRFHATIPPQDSEGNISVTIWAQDERGNRGTDGPYEVSIGDRSPPSISIPDPVTSAERLDPIHIRASVSDEHLSMVFLNYSVGNRFHYSIRMVQNGDYFTATIPPQNRVTKILYHVWANDTYGNSASTRNYSMDIVDTRPPVVISHPSGTIGPDTPLIITFNEEVDTVSAENSISIPGIQCSFRWVNGSSVRLIPKEKLKPGTYRIVIARGLTDIYGNGIPETQSFEFTVKDDGTHHAILWSIALIAGLGTAYVIWKKDLIPISVSVKRKRNKKRF